VPSSQDLILGPNDGNIAVERFYDLLTKLLAWEPEKRISVKDALEHPFIRLYTSEPRKY
jgi:serine/threonine protein kinase